jgi:hypothetical protein
VDLRDHGKWISVRAPLKGLPNAYGETLRRGRGTPRPEKKLSGGDGDTRPPEEKLSPGDGDTRPPEENLSSEDGDTRPPEEKLSPGMATPLPG